MDDIIFNVNNDIERQNIEIARNSEIVHESKRITKNIKIALINKLNQQSRKIKKQADKLRRMATDLDKDEREIKRQIHQLKHEINQ